MTRSDLMHPVGFIAGQKLNGLAGCQNVLDADRFAGFVKSDSANAATIDQPLVAVSATVIVRPPLPDAHFATPCQPV